VAAIELVLGREHVHRPALAARDTRTATGQFGHDHLGIDAIGQHVAMVAIAGDDAVVPFVERRLQAHRHGFLADIEVAEAADQAQAIELARLFLEAADQHHLLVELEQFSVRRIIALVVRVRLLKAAQGESGVILDRAAQRGRHVGNRRGHSSRLGGGGAGIGGARPGGLGQVSISLFWLPLGSAVSQNRLSHWTIIAAFATPNARQDDN
jgi:hypothetical protein